MKQSQRDRIEHIFEFMEYDFLTDGEEEIIISLENQYENKSQLSDAQIDLLESIFKRAAERQY